MVAYFPSLNENHIEFIGKQHLFFTGSSPLHHGKINVSPKGMADTSLQIMNSNAVYYQDGTGSGNETISHIYDNKRLTIMFCSFSTSPLILRLFGSAQVYELNSPQFNALVAPDHRIPGVRAVIKLHITLVQTSCGFGVPLMTFLKTRPTMASWANKNIENGTLLPYQQQNNASSLDGLPGLKSARKASGQRFLLWGDIKGQLLGVYNGKLDALIWGVLFGMAIMALYMRYQDRQQWLVQQMSRIGA